MFTSILFALASVAAFSGTDADGVPHAHDVSFLQASLEFHQATDLKTPDTADVAPVQQGTYGYGSDGGNGGYGGIGGYGSYAPPTNGYGSTGGGGAPPKCGHCPEYWKGDGWCDAHCVSDGCFLDDGGDCEGMKEGCHHCPVHWISDGICDRHCIEDGCFTDDGDDCKETPKEEEGPPPCIQDQYTLDHSPTPAECPLLLSLDLTECDDETKNDIKTFVGMMCPMPPTPGTGTGYGSIPTMPPMPGTGTGYGSIPTMPPMPGTGSNPTMLPTQGTSTGYGSIPNMPPTQGTGTGYGSNPTMPPTPGTGTGYGSNPPMLGTGDSSYSSMPRLIHTKGWRLRPVRNKNGPS